MSRESQVKVVKVVKVANVVKVKVFQVFKFFKEFLVPRACLTFRHFFQVSVKTSLELKKMWSSGGLLWDAEGLEHAIASGKNHVFVNFIYFVKYCFRSRHLEEHLKLTQQWMMWSMFNVFNVGEVPMI